MELSVKKLWRNRVYCRANILYTAFSYAPVQLDWCIRIWIHNCRRHASASPTYCMAWLMTIIAGLPPICPEIPDIPEISTIVLKLPWNQNLSWNFSHFVRMSCYTVVTALPLFCTWLHYIWTLLLLVLLAYLLTYYSFALRGLFCSCCLQQFSIFCLTD